jgi:hypothetical protein
MNRRGIAGIGSGPPPGTLNQLQFRLEGKNTVAATADKAAETGSPNT